MRFEVQRQFLAAVGLVGMLSDHTMAIGSESCGSFYQDPSCREDCGSCGTIEHILMYTLDLGFDVVVTTCDKLSVYDRSAVLYCSMGNRNFCFGIRYKATIFCIQLN